MILNSSKTKLASYLLWLIFILIVIIAKWDTPPSPGNVFNIYRTSGIEWNSSEGLYSSHRFLYLPFVATLFSFIAKLDFQIGGAIWRFLNITLFAFGIFQFCSAYKFKKNELAFLITTLIAIAISWSAARHGQMTLAMSAIMIFATNAIQSKKWNIAGIFLALAVALKPLAIVLLLVCIVIYPRTILSTLASLTICLMIPFLFQSSSYVLEQYVEFPQMLQQQANRAQDFMFIQADWTLKMLGISLSVAQQFALKMTFALATLFTCYKMKFCSKESFFLYLITSTYILLMGTGTEANTYAMISPVLGLLFADCVLKKYKEIYFLGFIIIVFLISKSFSNTYPNTILTMLKPIMTFLTMLLFLLSSKKFLRED